jgi:hypothetical protein
VALAMEEAALLNMVTVVRHHTEMHKILDGWQKGEIRIRRLLKMWREINIRPLRNLASHQSFRPSTCVGTHTLMTPKQNKTKFR